ncbi:thioredoxin domain-containing protein [Novosphingobium sp.]|uniref:DsbA family protein n=1 Tax=Novosphingobium sp. TaxID=1874826 RepID=UPI0025DFF2CF|nr:thioredoxin domain-containing protein [Novosphingobium sp.]MCC6926480.1 thioredoxin domain-containing protein [Novosphingobium sp.]
MTRRTIVALFGIAAIAVFVLAAALYTKPAPDLAQDVDVNGESVLFRRYSPVLGPVDAKVTLTEFFDPMCETCRDFFPVVEEIVADHQGKVRVVLRYATFHPGSENAVRLLEAARRQNKFEAVLVALLERQSEWASHEGINTALMWELAGGAGLDIAKAKQDAALPEIDLLIQQDMADAKAAGVTKTPTFFVNGKPLQSFGKQELYDMVVEEAAPPGAN